MEGLVGVLALLVWLLLAGFVGWLAKGFGRSALGWFILAVLFTPFVTVIFLVVAGDTPDFARREAAADDAIGDVECNQCGAPVNWATHEGVHSPERKPWMFICDQCGAEIQPET